MARILLALRTFPPDFSGAGKRASGFARRMHTKYAHQYRILCIRGTHAAHPVERNITRLRVVPDTGFWFPLHLFQVFVSANLYLHRNRNALDLIHLYSFSWLNRMLVLVNALSYRLPVIYENTLDHCDDPNSLLFSGKRNRLFRRFTRCLFKHINAFVVGSQYAKLSSATAGIDPEHVLVKPHPCDAAEFGSIPFERKAELRAKLDLPSGAFILLSVGTLYPRKNQLFLLQCLARIQEKDVVLVLVGPMFESNAGYIDELKEYVRTRKLSDRVLMVGEKQNINEYMIASDVFVFASKSEGFPNVIAESTMSGLPIVTTHFGCLEPYVNDTTGIMLDHKGVFDDSVAQRFASGIAKLRSQKARDRQAIRSFGMKHLSTDATDAEYTALYEQLINDHSTGLQRA